MSTSTTVSWKDCAAWMHPHFPCSTTPRPRRDRTMRPGSSNASPSSWRRASDATCGQVRSGQPRRGCGRRRSSSPPSGRPQHRRRARQARPARCSRRRGRDCGDCLGCCPARPRRREPLRMPRRTDISSVLVIGSGPIVIGQACEFDYSGTQACRVLRDDGLRVPLVNSNPATIMTDPEFAEATYIEPITPEFVEKIIAKERPDALLATLGGQTALHAAVALHERGVLERYGVELIGASISAIAAGQGREKFKAICDRIGADYARSTLVRTVEDAVATATQLGYPVVLRPSYPLGGAGGGFAHDETEVRRMVSAGLDASPVHEVLVEESVLGWKEY